jgi:hypothetical protein
VLGGGHVVGKHIEHPTCQKQLARAAGAGKGHKRLSGRGIENRNRLSVTEGDVDPVGRCHQTPPDLRRAAAETPKVRFPVRNRAIPQQHAAEGVPGHQLPYRRQVDRADGSLVDDVEDPSTGRDHGAHAGEVLVAPGVRGPAGPAQAPWRADLRIVGDSVVRSVIEEMAPLIQFRGPRLARDFAFPLPRIHHDAQRGEHPRDFILRNLPRISPEDDHLDEAVYIRQL